MNPWIEVFRTGTHTSGNGITKTYTEDDLTQIAKTYNEQKAHEAPLVIGHPKTDDPAHGWIKELKAMGSRLYAFTDKVDEWTQDSVRKGAFKKISIALYPNGLLRHVGLLGATPPAVKGLAPVQFGENMQFDEFAWATDEYRMPTVGRLFSAVRDFFIEKFGLETADKILPSDDVNRLQGPADSTYIPEQTADPLFAQTLRRELRPQEEEIMDEKQITEMTNNIIAAVTGAFTAKFTELDGKITAVQTAQDAFVKEFAEQTKAAEAKQKKDAQSQAVAEFSEFCESLIKDGKVLPAEKDGLIDQFKDLYRADGAVEFAEGEQSLTAKFKARLSAREAGRKSSGKPFARHTDAAPGKKEDIPATFNEVNPDKLATDHLAIDQEAREYAEKHNVTYEVAIAAVTEG